jgi:hypothetical protein
MKNLQSCRFCISSFYMPFHRTSLRSHFNHQVNPVEIAMSLVKRHAASGELSLEHAETRS